MNTLHWQTSGICRYTWTSGEVTRWSLSIEHIALSKFEYVAVAEFEHIALAKFEYIAVAEFERIELAKFEHIAGGKV